MINNIVNLEWDMFQKTQNIGGRAWCQDDRRQFDANRIAQFEAWDESSLNSYWEDLCAAKAQGHNLVSYKYAYMMKDTDPVGYEALRSRLPVISESRQMLIDRITDITLLWGEAFAVKYPCIAGCGRPLKNPKEKYASAACCDITEQTIEARDDSGASGQTSVESYTRGELATYGESTLRLLRSHYEEKAAEGVNLYEQIVRREMDILYGLSLEALEARLCR